MPRGSENIPSITSTSTIQPHAFLHRARELDRQGQTDAALDVIYDTLDESLQNGQFSEVDSILAECRPDELSLDVLLGLLTATLPARSRLPARVQFFHEVQEILKRRGEYEDGLLTGLQ